jgi:hypothetical protein
MSKHLAVFLVAIAFLGCTATTAQPAASATPSAAGYKNLKVLPHDISREQLLAVMRSFTRGLGVKCNHCHVVTTMTPKEELDFASDVKEEKRVARVMIQMTNQINREWLERVEHATDPEPRVGCWTCHRGHAEPETPPPPPPPAAPR